ncbi:AraC family transcriptional regulator [Paenibacillus thalictri]|uniref:AraC family transcriptional regulator n=1 Tax=Paenibacillus thalictri TaxID=2527873 RepID=A0A4Q9DJQ4_9BACL|nr:AraC family transcriptional regulator [Paenibacillus thalictri]TBL72674.1 AraC family transcriptional regulator [Paenibacillus thalictri]
MPQPESYYVTSNPIQPSQDEELYVLFTGISQTAPRHKLGPKVVDYYLLHHIESGKGTFTCEGVTYELGTGDSFFIEPGHLISYEADGDDPWFYRWIAFNGSKAAKLLHNLGITSHRPVVQAGDLSSPAAHADRIRTLFQERSATAHLKSSALLQLLLAEYADVLQPLNRLPQEHATAGEKAVQQAIQFITAQYAEPITMEMMAENLGYHRAYLSTLFRKYTGMTPVTFLLKHRIEKARHLLRERQELTVEQIAASVGFHDALYFSRQFRRWCGMPPTEYRESMKKL